MGTEFRSLSKASTLPTDTSLHPPKHTFMLENIETQKKCYLVCVCMTKFWKPTNVSKGYQVFLNMCSMSLSYCCMAKLSSMTVNCFPY